MVDENEGETIETIETENNQWRKEILCLSITIIDNAMHAHMSGEKEAGYLCRDDFFNR